jgi:CRISPR-associated endonuclease/helicase Cas3
MITLHLTGETEKVGPESIWNMAQRPLYHQWRTATALRDDGVHLVVNSYNTGVGKTMAALSHLCRLDGRDNNVLFVAPTNALLHQHEEAVRSFVVLNQLDFHVVAVTAATLRAYQQELLERGDHVDIRSGEALVRLIRNYREFHPDQTRRKGLIFVVNPDIFYYALMYQYRQHDARNLFQAFLSRFRYIIIDEFHYYDQKQLAFFLFFFAISLKLGYFEHAGRKICLLSATPNQHVITYLESLFSSHWRHISPDNEPPESNGLEEIATLTPLTLTLSSEWLEEWGATNAGQLIRSVLQDRLDGAIISNSLQRVNRLHALLRAHGLDDGTMRRITGPETQAERQIATKKPLILATPTVDIGYNFEKEAKPRQNLDFLICEARYGDDLIQRIGRAGRILGKAQQDVPSHATALISESALDALRLYDGRTLTRAHFKEIIRDSDAVLPQKHDLTGYIRTMAITEVFYPIYRSYRQMIIEDEKTLMEELYEDLRDLFGVRRGTFKSLSCYFRKYYYRQQWLKETRQSMSFNLKTAEYTADWLKYLGRGEFQAADIQPYLGDDTLLADPERQEALRRFVKEQVHLTTSLFNFRDSFQGPTAVFYDPNCLLSSEPVNNYDLLHIVRAYDVQWYSGRGEFLQLCGETELEGAVYGRLLGHRDPPLAIELYLDTGAYEEDFLPPREGRPVALSGIELAAREWGGALVPLDRRITQAIHDHYVTTLLIHPEQWGWVLRRLRNSPLYARNLTIDFLDRQQVPFKVFIGRAAWLAYPELQIINRISRTMKDEAIIL